MDNEKNMLQSIKNEINSLSEKIVYNTIPTDDINNNITELNKKMDSIIDILEHIRDSLDR